MNLLDLLNFFDKTKELSYEQDERDKYFSSQVQKYEWIKLIAYDESITIKREVGSYEITREIATQVLKLFLLALERINRI